MKQLIHFGVIFLIVSWSCNGKKQKDNSTNINIVKTEQILPDLELATKQRLLILIDSLLINKVDIEDYLNSYTKQDYIKILDTLEGEFDYEKREANYKWNERVFRLTITNKGLSTNTVFYDDNYKIDFSNHEVLTANNSEYKSETFGFNHQNKFRDVKVIEISNKKFLYADISNECVGRGCGCQINFIYDLEDKKAFFIDNFRFPFSGFFISDFDKDNVVDLLVVGRLKETYLKNLPIFKIGYQVTWFEYKNGNFVIRKSKTSNKPISLEFIAYSEYPDYGFDDIQFSLVKNE